MKFTAENYFKRRFGLDEIDKMPSYEVRGFLGSLIFLAKNEEEVQLTAMAFEKKLASSPNLVWTLLQELKKDFLSPGDTPLTKKLLLSIYEAAEAFRVKEGREPLLDGVVDTFEGRTPTYFESRLEDLKSGKLPGEVIPKAMENMIRQVSTNEEAHQVEQVFKQMYEKSPGVVARTLLSLEYTGISAPSTILGGQLFRSLLDSLRNAIATGSEWIPNVFTPIGEEKVDTNLLEDSFLTDPLNKVEPVDGLYSELDKARSSEILEKRFLDMQKQVKEKSATRQSKTFIAKKGKFSDPFGL